MLPLWMNFHVQKTPILGQSLVTKHFWNCKYTKLIKWSLNVYLRKTTDLKLHFKCHNDGCLLRLLFQKFHHHITSWVRKTKQPFLQGNKMIRVLVHAKIPQPPLRLALKGRRLTKGQKGAAHTVYIRGQVPRLAGYSAIVFHASHHTVQRYCLKSPVVASALNYELQLTVTHSFRLEFDCVHLAHVA